MLEKWTREEERILMEICSDQNKKLVDCFEEAAQVLNKSYNAVLSQYYRIRDSRLKTNHSFITMRELLGIPEALRAVQKRKPILNRKREHMANLRNVVSADRWARERAKELVKQGIRAEARRFRKNEPLAVCYKIPPAVAVGVSKASV